MRKLAILFAVVTLAAVGAGAAPQTADAHDCVYYCDAIIHPYSGAYVWCGASVAWNTIYLPWGQWQCIKVYHWIGSHWEWYFFGY